MRTFTGLVTRIRPIIGTWDSYLEVSLIEFELTGSKEITAIADYEIMDKLETDERIKSYETLIRFRGYEYHDVYYGIGGRAYIKPFMIADYEILT